MTLAATFLNLAFLAAAAGLFAKAVHDATGLPLRMSAAAAGLGFVSADLLRTALVPLSESAFLVLMMAAFSLWASAVRDEGRRERAWIAALLVAAVATRSAGAALVVAFGLGFTTRRGLKSAALVMSVAAPAVGEREPFHLTNANRFVACDYAGVLRLDELGAGDQHGALLRHDERLRTDFRIEACVDASGDLALAGPWRFLERGSNDVSDLATDCGAGLGCDVLNKYFFLGHERCHPVTAEKRRHA